MAEYVTGTAMPNLDVRSLLSNLVVSLPELAEQRYIASVLGSLDDKIELNRRMSQTLESVAQAFFKSWFVDFDPVRAKSEGRDPRLARPLADLFPDSLIDSELGGIPAGWETGVLGNVAELLRDREDPRNHPGLEYTHFSIPAFDEGQRPAREPGVKIQSLKSKVPPGTILLSKLNPRIERVWIVDVKEGERAIASTEFLVLQPRLPAGRAFLYGLCRSRMVRDELIGLATGTSGSHQRASTDAALRIPVVLPPSPIVKEFERAAEPLLLRWLALARETSTLQDLRDSLLPWLMSGQLPVGEAESMIGGAA